MRVARRVYRASVDGAWRQAWGLDPEIVFLNHGSFGATPRTVLAEQVRLRNQLEHEPVRFFLYTLEPLWDAAREEVAAFVGADPANLVFVRNATEAINGVLQSVALPAGSDVLITNQTYDACRFAVTRWARSRGAEVVVAEVPFPLAGAREVVDAVLAAATPRTRLALIDHVTSPTGVVWPIETLVAELQTRGIDCLVDGAHGPGMVSLDLETLGAAYYAANFHKWTCAPKGAGMLYVRPDRQHDVHPAITSHGYGTTRGRPRFHERWDWVGTDDPTPMLCVPFALRYLEGLIEGGWSALRHRNRRLVVAARKRLLAALDAEAPCPDEMLGALATVPLPEGVEEPASHPSGIHPLQRRLLERHGIEVPVVTWPAPPHRWLRVSAHLHNAPDDYARLVAALPEALDHA